MKRLAHEVADQLSLLADGRDDIWVLDGDLGDSYGLYDDDGLPRFRNFLQVGIAEQTLVGAAAGFAAAGRQPWVFSFSAFLCHRAADQIRTCVSQTALPVVLVGSHAGASTGANGASHSAVSDIAVIGALGGIEIWSPADAVDVSAAIERLGSDPAAAYIRASREPCAPLPLAPGDVRSNGVDGSYALLSTGLGSQWAMEVIELLREKGVSLPWSHLALLSDATVDDWAARHPGLKAVTVVEDHSVRGGLADAIRRRLSSGVEVESVGWPDGFHSESGSLDELRRSYSLDAAGILQRVERMLMLENR